MKRASRNRKTGFSARLRKPKNRTKSTGDMLQHLLPKFYGNDNEDFSLKPAQRRLLYMPAFVTKTGTSLPSRTRQFLALQITFRLKRTSPLLLSLSPSLSSFFCFFSLFTREISAFWIPASHHGRDDARGRIEATILSIDLLMEARSMTCYFMVRIVICF